LTMGPALTFMPPITDLSVVEQNPQQGLSQGERRLVAIMFTDVVGFTAMTQSNEATSLEVLGDVRRVVRSVLKSTSGIEVKTIGDAFLVEFPSALQAVTCAVEIQKSMRDRNSEVPDSKRMMLRIGVHLGDVIHSEGDVMGDAVNVASRIEPLSEPGGACISEQVYDHVRNKVGLPFERLEGKTLKNVKVPIDVYKLVMPWEIRTEEQGKLDPKRVAVLPFANMSPDPNDQYFTDGMTEELISALSRVKGLGVISRTSVMQYKNQSKHLTDIARELNVGTLIEGSVRKAGARIRITVQLIDARTDNHLWVENYERNLDDVFAIQSDVASKVAGSLEAGVFATAETKRDTSSMEAYTLYLRAMQLSHLDDEASLKEAIAQFEKAISMDRNFVRAYVGEALAWTAMAYGGYSELAKTLAEKAEVKALAALELAPNSAEVHATLSVIYGLLDRFEKSKLEAQEAVEISPNVAEAYYSLGMYYATLGDLETGLINFKRAYALDPLSSHTAQIIALVLRTAGHVEESMDVLARLQKLYPRNPKVYQGFAECHMLRGDFASAQANIDKGRMISSTEPRLRIDQGLIYVLTGRRNEALQVLADLQQDDNPSVRAYSRLFIRAALGDTEEAVDTLMQGVETHVWPFMIKTLPVFAELRKHPRFNEFCSKMGI